MTPVLIDLTLAIVGLLVVLHARTKDNISWFSLLAYPAYGIGGLAMGHLFLVVGLKTLLITASSDPVASAIYYLCCAFWGGLLVYLFNKLDGG